MKLKLGQFYKFNPNEAWYKHKFEPRHCFEGIFAVVEVKGKLKFRDIFWSHYHEERWRHDFSLGYKIIDFDWIDEYGSIELICDMDEVEDIEKYNLKYYDDCDLFVLTSQHGCCRYYFKRKGAEKSLEVMIKHLESKRKEEESKIVWAKRDIENIDKKLEKLYNGDMEGIYL